MKEEDIDEIFRDALGGQEAPTTASDWTAFEGMLNTRKKGLLKWPLLILLLLLIGGAAGAYYYFAEAGSTPEAGEVVTLSSEPSGKKADEATGSIREVPSEPSEQAGPNVSPNEDTAKSAAAMPLDQPSPQGETSADSTATPTFAKREATRSSENPSNKDAALQPAPSGIAAPPIDNLQPAEQKTAKSAAIDAEEEAAPSAAVHATRSGGGYGMGIAAAGGDETAVGEFGFLTPIDAGLFPSVNAELINDHRQSAPIKRRVYVPYVYFEIEQNTVLKTSPALGIGLQRNFALRGRGVLSVKAAVGYRRTGRLAWEQTHETTVFGFDRYASGSNLITNQLEMLAIPVKLSYDIGVHSVFVGAEINAVIHARQQFRSSVEGPLQEGYFYDSGAPLTSVFWQAGYGRALSERLQLDIGLNVAGAVWEPTGERPIGAFLRLNYYIR